MVESGLALKLELLTMCLTLELSSTGTTKRVAQPIPDYKSFKKFYRIWFIFVFISGNESYSFAYIL